MDIILPLQKIVHSFKRMKGSKAFMILKIDLEIAYDFIEYQFIMESLTLQNL